MNPLRVAAVVFLIVLVGCSAERQPLYSAPALWRVETGSGEIWLFPTLHYLPRDRKPRLVNTTTFRAQRSPALLRHQRWHWGPVRRALRETQGLVVESSEMHLASELREMVDEVDGGANREPLHRVVNQDQWTLVTDALSKRGIGGVGIETLSAEQILLLLYLIPTSSNLQLDPGVDRVLIRYAESYRLDVLALETTATRLAQMIGQFRRFDENSQWRLIESYTRATGRSDASIDALFREWEVGDLDPLAGSLGRMAERSPELYDVIFRLRNELWLDQILAYQKHYSNLFVAVGKGHFAGPDNLIDLFEERGLTVERVQ